MPGSTPSRLRCSTATLTVTPMSERQQLKLVRQLETGDSNPVSGNTTPTREPAPPRPRSRSCNGRGETPLHKAAIRGDEELVVKLLEEGADPNIPDFAGWTPLHEACNHGWYGVAVALVQAGALVNARGFDDDTPLHDAAINGHSKLVQLLVDRGADIFIRNKEGKTPCDVAPPGLMPHLLKSPKFNENIELSNTGTARRSYKTESTERRDRRESDVNVNTSRSSASAHSDDAALYEMRRTPRSPPAPSPQSKVEKSPRVTLRLHPLKKKTGKPHPEGLVKGTMEEKTTKEDVYEFKSSKEATPVRGNSTSPDVENTDKPERTDKTGEAWTASAEAESPSGKRSIADVTEKEETEEDSKKKKRKEETAKDGTAATKPAPAAGRLAAVRNANTNGEKGGKFSHVVGKSVPGGGAGAAKTGVASTSAGTATDRKSPSSPKGNITASGSSGGGGGATNKGENEAEDKAGADGEKAGPGPKVPPLKIVIPQQGGSEPEQGNRNGKHHQALPYVVSSNSNDSEKDGQRSGSVSPTDSLKSDEKKDPAIGMLSAEDQKGGLHHQRVLRSHRGGNGDERPATVARNGANGSNGGGQASTSGSSAPQTAGNPSSGSTTVTSETALPPTQNPSPPAAQADRQADPDRNPGSSAGTNESVTTTTAGSTNYGSFRSSTAVPAKTSTTTSNPASTSTAEEKPKTEEPPETSGTPPTPPPPAPVELHPRKRKLKHNKEVKEARETPPAPQAPEPVEPATTTPMVHPHEVPVKNCYQLFLDIRKQIERRRKGLFPVQPKPPQGFKDYLMNRCTYVLAGNASTRQIPSSPAPQNLTHQAMKDQFTEQEKERHRLRLQHIIEKEKLVLSVEQEILRVHGRAARALANQTLPFSVCTILKDEEVYNLITPEEEEKDRNARSRYNGRLFLSWLQDVDDKWEKIKENMLLRHHNEAESLHAVQKMDWEWKMKELGLCEFKSKPVILDIHVPMVHVSDDFDLLPA